MSSSSGETGVSELEIEAFVTESRAVSSLSHRFGLVLIHGFSATFIMSMIRAAQIASEYGAASIICFSWPAAATDSLGELIRVYRRDKESAEKSAPAIADFLSQTIPAVREAANTASTRFSLIAHSMGNFALRCAVQIIKETAEDVLRGRAFETACLMCADEDLWAMKDNNKLKPLADICDEIDVYWSTGDLALAAARLFNSKPRFGLAGVYKNRRSELSEKIIQIECSRVSHQNDNGNFEHQYYRLSPAVIADVRRVLRRAPTSDWRLPDYDAHAPEGKAWIIPLYPDDAIEFRLALSEIGIDQASIPRL